MSSKPTLIYVYDPLCGWCYGFHPVMEKIKQRFDEQLSIEVKPGGLAVGDRAQTIARGYSFINDALHQVEKTAGVEFGRNFKLLAEEGSYLYDSMPPCRAQVAVNQIAPARALSFAGAMQKALFMDGKNLNKRETYHSVIDELNINKNEFDRNFESEQNREKTLKKFEWCKKMSANGFPTLLLKVGEEFGVMARGYRPYDVIESHLHHLLNNIQKISS